MDNYQLFVLNCVSYSDLNTSEENIFGSLLTLRIKGYFDFHGHNVMPVDQHDHYCTNLLLCEKSGDEYYPLACAKVINYSDCQERGMKFPPVDILENSQNKEALDSVNRLIEQAKVAGEDITYDCSFTICPDKRGNHNSAHVAKYLLASWLSYHHHNNINQFILSATIKTKTDRTFSRLGCKPVCSDTFYKLYSINYEQALMMNFDDYSHQALRWIKDARGLWENRIEIGKKEKEPALNVA
ncbi:hypothetical protein [Photobacterium lutimaris]|uniref:N-acetyltransferase n=1 Tax=Photobacterium lutimaris TaxID=388278 RepID=A0A2T3IWG6_9GAMM|nr:hypothetical protein [Photobacterium lutimaris]PSU32789.1 hypothetical protein C9I99_17245 [Photobacterium lutimaris]TDR74404.1 hypothetical protein DFP78_108263 [Photobacterium lutimaris]